MGVFFETFTRDLIAVLAILVSIGWLYVRHVYGLWQRKGAAFPAPSFPFGSFKETLLQRKPFGGVIQEIYDDFDNQAVVGIWQAFRPTLLIRDPELVRQIFITDFNVFHDRGAYCDEERDPLSGHLFLLAGEKWRQMRGQLSPTFTSGKLKAMFSTLVACGAPLDAFVDQAATNKLGTIEVRELLAQFTTNVIASVAFGIDIDCIADPNTSFRKFGRKVFDPSMKNGIRGALAFMVPGLMKYSGLKSVDADVEEFMLSVVSQNMTHREQNNVSRKDFFQLLLQLRNTGSVQEDGNFETNVTSAAKSMSIPECAAQSFVFFTAGFETSSSAMSFALYEFAKNVECMRRAQMEIDDVLAKHDGQITYESVGDMKYLDWCIDETLRLWPPVQMMLRETNTQWTVPNSNITLDKNTPILIPAHALQMDPKYWPEPHKFMPDRFSPEQCGDLTFAERPYMPFGAGPRNCIGLRLAKMQTKVGLIFMLKKYNYELAGSSKEPLKMNPAAFLMTPLDGINLKITHRVK